VHLSTPNDIDYSALQNYALPVYESHRLDDKWEFSRNGSVPSHTPLVLLNNVKNQKAESVLDLSPLVSVVTLFAGTGILFGSI
jgi:hypothetical protein